MRVRPPLRVLYIDSSALLKLLWHEPESDAVSGAVLPHSAHGLLTGGVYSSDPPA